MTISQCFYILQYKSQFKRMNSIKFVTAWQISSTLSNMEKCLENIQKDAQQCKQLTNMLPLVNRMNKFEQQKLTLRRQIKSFTDVLNDTQLQNKQQIKGPLGYRKKLTQLVDKQIKQNKINSAKISTFQKTLQNQLLAQKNILQKIRINSLEQIKILTKNAQFQITHMIQQQNIKFEQGIFMSSARQFVQNKSSTHYMNNCETVIANLYECLGQIKCKLQTLKDKKRKITVKKHFDQLSGKRFDQLSAKKLQLNSNKDQYLQQNLSISQINADISELLEQIGQGKDKLRQRTVYSVEKLQRVMFDIKKLTSDKLTLTQNQILALIKEKQIIFKKQKSEYEDLKIGMRAFQKYLKRKLQSIEWKYRSFIQKQSPSIDFMNESGLNTRIEGVRDYVCDTIQKLSEVYSRIQNIQRLQYIHSSSELIFF